MGKTLGRITYSLFFLLFFIAAPLLTAYSLGYRYDFSTGSIEKNGAFYIKSYPRDARIYIDGNKIKNTTPTQITNVKPGVHKLTVEKEKYVPWSKKLKIDSGETTFAEDIVLFFEERPIENLGPGSENYLINQEKNKYAYLDPENRLIITDMDQAKNFYIFDFDTNYSLIDWSADNRAILLKNQDSFFVFDINQKELKKLDLKNIQKIIWEENSNRLIYLKNNQLYRYEISHINEPNNYNLDTDRKINDFDIYNNFLVIQYSEGLENFVEQLDKNSLESKLIVENLHLGKLGILTAENNQLAFTLGSTLYIKNMFRDLISIPMTMTELHDQRLLLTNGHEIVLYNYQDDWQELIDRSSNIVSEILWHPNGSYFLSEINNQTYITELDGRDRRNSIMLLENPLKKHYLFNKKGDKLFVLTPEENFYLTIQ